MTITTGRAASSPATPIERRLRDAGLPALRRLAWIEVDLSILEANARLIRGLLPTPTRLGIVVKAGGYGHGLVASARSAAAGGADLLLVATLDEALALRAAGVDLPVLVLYPVPRDAVLEAVRAGIGLTAADPASLRDLVVALRVRGARPTARPPGPARIHLAVDTGMTRGGFQPERALQAAARLAGTPGIELAGVWSHLASPELPEAVAAQLSRFECARRDLAAAGLDAPAHLAASGGLFGTAPPFDLVRVGLAFYGLLPPGLEVAPGARHVAGALRPALALKARAVSVADVAEGTEVGYGGTWRASRPSTIATLPVGYADGWSRLYSPGASVLAGGRRVPVVGRVSSDAFAVDVTDAMPLPRDAELVLLGEQGSERIDVAELATLRRSIPWEVLDTLGDRLARVFVRDGAPVGVMAPGASMQDAVTGEPA
jgi:alanine racemase